MRCRKPGQEDTMDLTLLLSAAPAAALLLLSAKVLSAPLRISLRAALNSAFGLISLLLVDAAGLSPGIDPLSISVMGILGVPGLGLMFLIRWVFT